LHCNALDANSYDSKDIRERAGQRVIIADGQLKHLRVYLLAQSGSRNFGHLKPVGRFHSRLPAQNAF
jgi:hypothetical protein